MTHTPMVLVAVLLALGFMQCSFAYGIKYRGRTDLIRIGTGPLRGAEPLAGEFSLAAFVEGIGYTVLAVLVLVLRRIDVVLAVLLIAGMAFVYRQSLIRGVLRGRNDVAASEA